MIITPETGTVMEDFQVQQFGMYGFLHGNIPVSVKETDQVDHTFGVTINLECHWNTFQKSFRDQVDQMLSATVPGFTSANYENIFNMPIMVGFRYKLQSSTHSVGMAVDFGGGANLFYKSKAKINYKIGKQDYSEIYESGLSCGAAAHGALSLLLGDHFAIGFHYHFLSAFGNKSTKRLVEMPSSNEISSSVSTDKDARFYEHMLSLSLEVVFSPNYEISIKKSTFKVLFFIGRLPLFTVLAKLFFFFKNNIQFPPFAVFVQQLVCQIFIFANVFRSNGNAVYRFDNRSYRQQAVLS